MRFSDPDFFDNAIVRSRGKHCIVSTVAAPFVTGYWPDTEDLISELGFAQSTIETLVKPDVQRRFLSALADKVPETAVFKPEAIGFKWRTTDIRSREEFRASQCSVTFLGNCSKAVVIGALDAIAQRVMGNDGTILDVQFKQWDVLSDWQMGKERLNIVLDHLQVKKLHCSSLTFFSSCKEVPDDLWEYLYDWPQMRVGWMADGLAECGDMAQFEQYRRENLSFINLEKLSNKGIFPHILFPATKVNTRILPELIQALMAAIGGGTIEIIPVPLMPDVAGDPPSVEDYTAALMAIYKNAHIPLRTIAPQSWAADRIDSNSSLISSPEAAGASLTVLANGDVYASEASVGQDIWRLGNILEDGEALRWERLDAMPEVFSSSTKPEECKTCDWRYRCGGVDTSVLLLKEHDASTDWQTLFQLYCAPRKALFEEIFLDSIAGSVSADNETAKQGKTTTI